MSFLHNLKLLMFIAMMVTWTLGVAETCEMGGTSNMCCTPQPFVMIGFHLQFNSSAPLYIDQGVRLEYQTYDITSAETSNLAWQALRYYTPSLLHTSSSAVELNPDNKSVTAQAFTYSGSLPLHVVNTSLPVHYQEYVLAYGTALKIRWLQRYTSVAPSEELAAWSLDNVTVAEWDGQEYREVLHEDFENSTCISTDDYAIRSAMDNCTENMFGNKVIYFNGYGGDDNSRRSFVIKQVNFESAENSDSGTTSTNNHNMCPSQSCSSNSSCSVCPKGFYLDDSLMTCVDIDECQEVTHNCVFPMECINIAGGFQCECSRGYGLDQDYNNCTDIPNTDKSVNDDLLVECQNNSNCNGESEAMSVRDCCLENEQGLSFMVPGYHQCYECIVYGWLSDSYSGEEGYQSHVLQIGFRKGRDAIAEATDFLYDVVSIENATHGAKRNIDFEVNTKVAVLNQFVLVTLLEDFTALETEETFHLKLKPRSPLQPSLEGVNVLFCDTIEITIFDRDYVDVYFTRDDFRASESEQSIPIRVGKSRKIATPLSLRLRPAEVPEVTSTGDVSEGTCPDMCTCECQLNPDLYGSDLILPSFIPVDSPASPNRATGGVDFSTKPLTITFMADESDPQHEISARISIMDDTVNEADQVFIVSIELEHALVNTSVWLDRRPSTLCRIVDNDSLRIGFTTSVQELAESDSSSRQILLTKEGAVQSEQTFSVLISTLPVPGILPAIQLNISVEKADGDYALTNSSKSGLLMLVFPPSLSVLHIDLAVFNDDIAEGTEAFRLHSSSLGGGPSYDFPISTHTDTTVIIKDDDKIMIGFESDHVVLSELDGAVEVCIKYFNAASAKTAEEASTGVSRYDIKVDYESINGSAVSGEDYLPIPPTSILLNDYHTSHCINITIVDNLLLENIEAFSINITNYQLLPSSLNFDPNAEIVLEHDSTEISIVDDDKTVIGFLKSHYEIAETEHDVTVMLAVTGAELEREVIVSISTHDISSRGGLDYVPISNLWLIFSPDMLQTPISVNITDDFLFEYDEVFLIRVELISEHFPGLSLQSNVTITIIDNDDVTSTLNDQPVANHQLLYFDEIGYNQSTGIVCSGRASDVCCYDYNTLSEGEQDGSDANGVGSWVDPSGAYVRYNCTGCEDLEQDNFQIHRTRNATVMFQNEEAVTRSSGIYRCEIPLNISSDGMPLTQYVGIYERGTGELILVQHIQLTVISTNPPAFSLRCVTSGGPLAVTYWTRNDQDILNNATFKTSLVVEDYVEAVYNHTLIVNGSIPGTYEFFAKDPFLLDGSKFVSSAQEINPEDLTCSGGVCLNISCDSGFNYDIIQQSCEDINECEDALHNCTAIANSECVNTNGSYFCECSDSHLQLPDGTCGLSVVAASSIIGSIALLLLITAFILAAAALYLRMKRRSAKFFPNEELSNSEDKLADSSDPPRRNLPIKSSLLINMPKEMFISASHLELGEPIGQGEFGIVYKGHLSKDFGLRVTNVVAVKTLKGFHEEGLVRELLRECVKMREFDHPNVLTLTGVCLDGGPAPFIIMPFMSNGSLLSHLKKSRKELLLPENTPNLEEVEVTTMKLMDMCIQIAKGMEYLAARKLVHRDLAARNCMIDMNHVIKVADFGLSVMLGAKDYFRQGRDDAVKLPVKWLAIESMNDSIFSEKSDVWAYGVTCWEIFSGGKTPHASINPMNLLPLLEDGYRLEKPANAACTDEMYSLMLKCWANSPTKRPTFSELVSILSSSLADKAGYLDVSAFSDHRSTVRASRSEPRVSVLHAPSDREQEGRKISLAPTSDAAWAKHGRQPSLQNLYVQK